MNALFDFDGFVYRAAFSAQRTIRHVVVNGEEDVVSSFLSYRDMVDWMKEKGYEYEDLTIEEELSLSSAGAAINAMKHFVERVELAFPDIRRSEYYLTGSNNFRKLLYPEYKANRTKPKPVFYDEVLDYAERRMGAQTVDGMEADDALTIRATELTTAGEDWVIVSQDKDLLTYPGTHYNWVDDVKRVVDPLEAAFIFYCQVLTGDTSDNIPGLYKVGPKKAAELLIDCLEPIEMWEVCKREYASREIPEKDLIRNCRLLHMLRTPDDLWEPPNGK